MTSGPLQRELEVASRLAVAAGAAAMRHYGSARAEPGSAASPVTEGDRASNEVIHQGLVEAFPGDGLLSEEMRDSAARLSMERVWIVDPLDGTKEFLAQNGEFSVMIGLAVRGEAVLGVVYRPDGDVLYAAARGSGAHVQREGDRQALRCLAPDGPALRLVGSRSHADPMLERIRTSLGITDVRPSGSVGLKCALIAEGNCDLYVHPVPYLKEWDTCAPEAILREAGGSVTDCHGAPLRYNKPDPVQPGGIVACAPGILARVLEHVTPHFAA